MPAPVQPVPDTEALRRALLAASWQRDRVVSRRRLAVRWLLWLARHHGPKLLVAGVLLLWMVTLNQTPPEPAGGLSLGRGNPEAATPAVDPPSHSKAAAGPPAVLTEAPNIRFSPALRLSVSLAPAAGQPAASEPAAQLAPGDLKTPILTFDHWLHSKEP